MRPCHRGSKAANRRARLVAGVFLTLALLGATHVASADELTLPTPCPHHGEKFEPDVGKVLHIVGQDNDSFNDYVAATGITPAGVMFYEFLAPAVPKTAVAGRQDPVEYMLKYPN